MPEDAKKSVALRTYLFLEETYLAAGDESPEETEARGIMDLVWNLLSEQDRKYLDARGMMREKRG
jgi:hypothetical protein